MDNTLENNPIAEAITEKIREMLYEDISKSDIREAIKTSHPNFPSAIFEECFSEAFATV
jgi:hypothetical protein